MGPLRKPTPAKPPPSTAAAAPILDLGHPPAPKTVRALILAPTRRLVNTSADNLEIFTKGTAVKVAMVVGGTSLFKQAERLKRGADILVAWPD